MSDETSTPERSQMIEGRCAFYLAKKRRYCRMYAAKENGFCVEHSNHAGNEETECKRRRIPCPLNPKHTCYEDQLKKHIKKCNSRLRSDPVYFMESINSGEVDAAIQKDIQEFSVNKISDDAFFGFIEKLEKFFQDNVLKIDTEILHHNVLDGELNNPAYGSQVLKHCKQQASLLGHLEKIGALSSHTTYIEFGAGKGQLCHWIQRSLNTLDNVKFLLVERSGIRYKKDVYHNGENDGPSFERLRMDIAHLCLSKHPTMNKETKDGQVVAVSKHLCGAATDLTLRCFVNTLDLNENSTSNSSQKKSDRSLVIAVCCHHRCSWKEYVGKQFFHDNRFTWTDFMLAVKLTSWAVCGFRDLIGKKGESEDTPSSEKEKENVEDSSSLNTVHRCSTFSSEQKERIGWQCKRLIDLGRTWFLQNAGFDTDLRFYIEKDVSLENMVMIATKK